MKLFTYFGQANISETTIFKYKGCTWWLYYLYKYLIIIDKLQDAYEIVKLRCQYLPNHYGWYQ